ECQYSVLRGTPPVMTWVNGACVFSEAHDVTAKVQESVLRSSQAALISGADASVITDASTPAMSYMTPCGKLVRITRRACRPARDAINRCVRAKIRRAWGSFHPSGM